eukprot:3941282-Rhodomonas_salina.1
MPVSVSRARMIPGFRIQSSGSRVQFRVQSPELRVESSKASQTSARARRRQLGRMSLTVAATETDRVRLWTHGSMLGQCRAESDSGPMTTSLCTSSVPSRVRTLSILGEFPVPISVRRTVSDSGAVRACFVSTEQEEKVGEIDTLTVYYVSPSSVRLWNRESLLRQHRAVREYDTMTVHFVSTEEYERQAPAQRGSEILDKNEDRTSSLAFRIEPLGKNFMTPAKKSPTPSEKGGSLAGYMIGVGMGRRRGPQEGERERD